MLGGSVNKIGTPLKKNSYKIMLLGSGELGKEITIELMRIGAEVIACDKYANAPAMHVAHSFQVFDMLDASELRRVTNLINPNLIVPEVEGIATLELLKLEAEGYHVVPNARAVNLTMDREGIRRFASEKLGLPTAAYAFAENFEELKIAAQKMGFPCVIKSLMSSSGKGQSIAGNVVDLPASWALSQFGGRAGAGKVIVEEFISFESEITLLTVRAVNGTHFCEPIGHLQKDGDYIESWQPHFMNAEQLMRAQDIAKSITDHLGGHGLFGVELFLLHDGRVLFSEVSPRPHDTGLVTLCTQKLSEFALHARAIMGSPIGKIGRLTCGASLALRAQEEISDPTFMGISDAFSLDGIDVKLFGKPKASPNRRLGVVLAEGENVLSALKLGRQALSAINIVENCQ